MKCNEDYDKDDEEIYLALEELNEETEGQVEVKKNKPMRRITKFYG